MAAAAIFAVATPLTAQQTMMSGPEEWTWSSDRPDAAGPLGMFGAGTLGMGQIELTYNFSQMNARGVWFAKDSLDLATTLALYNDAPLTRSDIRHQVRIGYGVTDELTLVARGEFAVLERETIANNGLIRTGIENFGDVEVGAVYTVYGEGPYRLNVQGGGIIPTGASTTYADTTASQSGTQTPLPYDMRPGSGTFGVTAALSGSVQNQVGSLGAQFRMRVNVGSNSAGTAGGYTLGDMYEFNGYAAYNINEYLSIMAGGRWQSWDNIAGFDDRLDVDGDPHNMGAMLAGQRAMLPMSITLVLPESSVLGGHRLSFEAIYSMHHDYEGPQLGLDWGLNFGYTITY
ncbi:MAG: hypothetical protein OEN56_11975 [Gemmatimonadota bacterium]|nr:hypothetical protein [Gemmatimonadota bacterium]